MIFFIVYLIGCIIAKGAVGPVRDEMEGVGDMLLIVFWPIWLAIKILSIVVNFLLAVGSVFRRTEKNEK